MGNSKYCVSCKSKGRDYQPLQSLILQGLFYATPIIFQTSILKDKGFELVYRLNPFYYLLEIVRTPMQGREIPSLDIYLIAIAISLIVFSISIFVIMKNQKTLVSNYRKLFMSNIKLDNVNLIFKVWREKRIKDILIPAVKSSMSSTWMELYMLLTT
jgi:hypothetical protein